MFGWFQGFNFPPNLQKFEETFVPYVNEDKLS